MIHGIQTKVTVCLSVIMGHLWLSFVVSFAPLDFQVSKALHSHIARLLLAREKLRKIWKSAEKRMLVHTKIHKYRDKATKVRDTTFVEIE